jgi:manganese transport protein
MFPLIRLVSNAKLMGSFKISKPVAYLAWFIFASVVAGNIWMLIGL